MGAERWDLFISSRRKGITPPLRGRRDERCRSLTTYQSAAASKSVAESSGSLICHLGLPAYSLVELDGRLFGFWFWCRPSYSALTAFSSALQAALNYQLRVKINQRGCIIILFKVRCLTKSAAGVLTSHFPALKANINVKSLQTGRHLTSA